MRTTLIFRCKIQARQVLGFTFVRLKASSTVNNFISVDPYYDPLLGITAGNV